MGPQTNSLHLILSISKPPIIPGVHNIIKQFNVSVVASDMPQPIAVDNISFAGDQAHLLLWKLAQSHMILYYIFEKKTHMLCFC